MHTMTLPTDTEILVVREFDAPRELVFKAMTDATMIPKWWGPRMLTTTVEKLDAWVGGGWRFLQYDPEGKEYAFRGEFLALDPPASLRMTFEFEPMAGHIIVQDVQFEDIGGRTRLISRSTYPSKADRDGMIEHGMEWGMREGYERLDDLLAELSH